MRLRNDLNGKISAIQALQLGIEKIVMQLSCSSVEEDMDRIFSCNCRCGPGYGP
jgi:hypothetical protein